MNQRFESKTVKLWDTPVFVVKNKTHASLQQGLRDFIYAEEEKQTAQVDSNVAPHLKHNLSESKFDFLKKNHNESVAELSKFINAAALECITKINRSVWERKYAARKPVIDIHESWYHITRTGGSHGTHMHAGCSWCGIYYIDVGDRSSPTFRNKVYSCFDDELYATKGGKNRFHSPFSSNYYDPGMDYLFANDTFSPEPMDGMLILFPSYLMHCGDPYVGKSDRLLVAMNMKVNLEEVSSETR